jgi:hypothetical protein
MAAAGEVVIVVGDGVDEVLVDVVTTGRTVLAVERAALGVELLVHPAEVTTTATRPIIPNLRIRLCIRRRTGTPSPKRATASVGASRHGG